MKTLLSNTSGIVAVMMTIAATPAFAQTAPQERPGVENADEIVVTARRREEKLADVPATISAISAENFVKQGIRTEADLQIAVPGLVIRTGNLNNQLNYVIRGESIDSYSGSVPGVQPYVNEVPISANGSSNFFDIEGVQVLKGPQGTLFGRNTTGGAVLYQTTKPKWDNSGYASVQYGNFDKLVTEGALNSVIVEDKAAIRVAGSFSKGGGFQRNLYDGSELGNQKTYAGRISLALKPFEGWSNLTTVELSRTRGTNLNPQPYYVIPCGQPGGVQTCNFTPTNPAFQQLLAGNVFPGYPGGNTVFAGGLADYPAFIRQFGPYTGQWNAPNTHRANTALVQNTTEIDLGGVTLKNVFGYTKTYSGNLYDDDGTPYPILQSGVGFNIPGGSSLETTKTHAFTNELQLQGKAADDRLTYIAGLYYEHNAFIFNSPISGTAIFQTVPGVEASSQAAAFAIRYTLRTFTDTYAAFGQVTYALTDKLNLTAGSRYTSSKITSRQGAGSVFGSPPPQSDKQSEPSWTFTADYKVMPELMLYATTRGSWRVGGYSPAGVPLGNTVDATGGGNFFQPEKVRDIEIGAKFSGRIGGMPVQANIDGFNTWITDVQKIGYFIINGNIASNTINVPKTKISGIEGDMQIRPTDWLKLGANASYTRARFTKNQVTLFGAPVVFGPYGDVPKYSAAVFGEVTQELSGDAGTLSLRGDAYVQSGFYFSSLAATANPNTFIPGYLLVNMRLDWANPMGLQGFTASAFVKNLGNRLYYTGGNPGAQNIALEAVNVGTPRTYGAVLRYSF